MDVLTGVDKRALDRIKELEATEKRLREALTEIWQLDAPGQCAEIANAALEGEYVES
jgi:hypothetical protein